ncbi:MAG: hypothetical protein KGD60_16410 [Candidatus Thorarchaeota archaeon]|nr:hypothetical protein [Candidatus Thorarchaeota archaeon]
MRFWLAAFGLVACFSFLLALLWVSVAGAPLAEFPLAWAFVFGSFLVIGGLTELVDGLGRRNER